MRWPTISDPGFEDTEPQRPVWEVSKFNDPRIDETVLSRDDVAPILVIAATYPRIYEQIKFLWGTQELQNRFTHWILTDQEGRQGWPAEVLKALFALSNEHAEKFGLEGEPKWGGRRDRW